MSFWSAPHSLGGPGWVWPGTALGGPGCGRPWPLCWLPWPVLGVHTLPVSWDPSLLSQWLGNWAPTLANSRPCVLSGAAGGPGRDCRGWADTGRGPHPPPHTGAFWISVETWFSSPLLFLWQHGKQTQAGLAHSRHLGLDMAGHWPRAQPDSPPPPTPGSRSREGVHSAELSLQTVKSTRHREGWDAGGGVPPLPQP